MTGSTSLVAAMAGDVKKAASMLDTLAPEVSTSELHAAVHKLHLHCFCMRAFGRNHAMQDTLAT